MKSPGEVIKRGLDGREPGSCRGANFPASSTLRVRPVRRRLRPRWPHSTASRPRPWRWRGPARRPSRRTRRADPAGDRAAGNHERAGRDRPDRAALLEPLERRWFPQTKDASELEAIVLYGAWKAGAAVDRIKPELRRLSARSMTAEGYALLATIAASIDDANVKAACKPIAPFATEYKKQVAQDDAAMHASIDKVVAALPAEVETSLGGFTVRGAKQPGRNDPCSCGSGLKYKKCCADKPVATPSPIPGRGLGRLLLVGEDAARAREPARAEGPGADRHREGRRRRAARTAHAVRRRCGRGIASSGSSPRRSRAARPTRSPSCATTSCSSCSRRARSSARGRTSRRSASIRLCGRARHPRRQGSMAGAARRGARVRRQPDQRRRCRPRVCAAARRADARHLLRPRVHRHAPRRRCGPDARVRRGCARPART